MRWPARPVDVGDGADRPVVTHQKALPHQHVGLRKFHRAGARGRVGDEADVGLALTHRIDHALRARRRRKRQRHADAARELAGEVGRSAANVTARRVARRLRLIAGEIDGAQRAGRRDLVGGGGEHGERQITGAQQQSLHGGSPGRRPAEYAKTVDM
jgi:hypothetical protein